MHRLISSLCKSVIRKLLVKDENRRLGSRAGASDVKNHPFFRTTSWALLRHTRPPMIPLASKGTDAVNFRSLKESYSVDMSGTRTPDRTPAEEAIDPFMSFNSVTLHYDGDLHASNGDSSEVVKDKKEAPGELPK